MSDPAGLAAQSITAQVRKLFDSESSVKWTAESIAQALELRPEHQSGIRQALNRLMIEGHVAQAGRGVYIRSIIMGADHLDE